MQNWHQETELNISYYAQFNKIDHLNHAVVIFENEVPVACGAMKASLDEKFHEVKRMYALENKRGQGFAQLAWLNWKNGQLNLESNAASSKPENDSPKPFDFTQNQVIKPSLTTANTSVLKICLSFEKILSGC
ncbi:MAG: hypothetical protein R2784_02020 [Saprospiraceae bacterium]